MFEVNQTDICIRDCYQILEPELSKVCTMDLSILFIFVGFLALSIGLRFALLKYSKDWKDKSFNLCLFYQFTIMIFSIIMIGLWIRFYIGWI